MGAQVVAPRALKAEAARQSAGWGGPSRSRGAAIVSPILAVGRRQDRGAAPGAGLRRRFGRSV